MRRVPIFLFIIGLLAALPLPQKLHAAQEKKLRLAYSALAYANPRPTAEAICLYNSRPELTRPVVAKFMRVPKDDPALRHSQQSLGLLVNQDLAPSMEGIKFVLDFLAEKQPNLEAKNPAEFVDARFLRRLDEEGFFTKFVK